MTTQNTAPVSTQDYENEDVIDLHFLFGLFKAHKWFIVTVVVICVVLGGGYSVTRPAIYESSAIIKVNGDSNAGASNLSALIGLSTGSASAGLMSASPAEIETALMQSNYIMGAVSEDLGLNIEARPKYFPIVGRLFANLFKSTNNNLKVAVFDIPETMKSQRFILSMENDDNSYTLYDTEGRKLLGGKLGELATSQDKTISINIASWNKTSEHTFVITKQPTDLVVNKLLKNLTIKEQGQKTGILSISYESSNPLLSQQILNSILQAAVKANVAEKAAEASKTLEFLQKQLPQITQDLDTSENRLNTYRSETGTVDETIEAELLLQEIVSLEKDLNELNLKKLELLEDFTSKHPYVIAMNQKEEKLEEQLNAVKAQLRKLPLTTQEAENFMRDIKVHGEIYSDVMQTVQQMEMLQGGTISSVRILENASYPVLPNTSKTPLILLVSLIFGLFLSMMILLLQYSLAKTLDPLLLEKILGVQVLAIIPHSLTQVRLFKQMRSLKVLRQNYLLCKEQSKDVSVEALRSLRTALKLASLSEDKKVIAISGCSPSIGKSFVSSNLVALLGDLGGKVLLIDADMRKGYMNKIFSCEQTPGLSEYLQDNISIEKIINNVLPNVALITTGEYPSNPAELLMNKKFKHLIDEVSKQYDFILIDTPPVLAVTDASLIFKFSDIRLLLVSLSKDQLKEIEHAKGILMKSGLTIDGIVCNQSQQNRSKYGSNGGYSYHYKYE